MDAEDKRLAELAAEVAKAKADAGLTPPAPLAGSKARGGLQTGMEMAVSILFCTGVGVGLDKWLGSAPLFILVGLVLGSVAGLWSVYRATISKDEAVGLRADGSAKKKG